jgi:hypothetical protein
MTRRLVCLSVPALAALSAVRHVPQGRHFALLLLFDARDVAAAAIGAVAERLVDEGLATFAVWGPDCERVHDILDESCVMREIRDGREYPVIMTRWYPNRPLGEAVWGILHPLIDEGYEATCETTLIVTVANDGWDCTVRRLVQTQTASPGML